MSERSAVSTADNATIAKMRNRILKPIVFTLALVPLLRLFVLGLLGELGANPIAKITHQTGLWTLILLLVTLGHHSFQARLRANCGSSSTAACSVSSHFSMRCCTCSPMCGSTSFSISMRC